MNVHRVYGVHSRKPKIMLITMLKTGITSRKPKRIESDF